MTIRPIDIPVPGARKAILYIHGILGTPGHFRDFFPLVSGCSQYSILLDGHGGNAGDFAKTRMTIWKKQVHDKVVELLGTYESLLIVAHSMGTLFAISEALLFPDRVKGIFLLASPLKLSVKPRLAMNCWKVFCGHIAADDHHALAAQQAYGITKDYHIYRYLGWIPRYLELFREIRRVRGEVQELRVPVVAFQSEQDEMVSRKAVDILKEVPETQVYLLENSTHFYYDPSDLQWILQAFSKFIKDI